MTWGALTVAGKCSVFRPLDKILFPNSYVEKLKIKLYDLFLLSFTTAEQIIIRRQLRRKIENKTLRPLFAVLYDRLTKNYSLTVA